MNINIIGNDVVGSKIVQLSTENPFKKGSLPFYLIDFIIKNCDNLNNKIKDGNNNQLLKFLKKQKQTFYIDCWSGENLFEQALSLAFVHNIIKTQQTLNSPIFGLFAEDGLFDVLNEPSFTEHLPTGDIPDNFKLLWLALFMNSSIREKNHVPKISFNKKNPEYHSDDYKLELSFDKLSYNKLFDSSFNIPLQSFSDCWMTDGWIALNSRGLFHHIGDQVAFFYGANSVGDCYFVGKNIFNQLVTLSTHNFKKNDDDYDNENKNVNLFLNNDEKINHYKTYNDKTHSYIYDKTESYFKRPYLDRFSNVHHTDFLYIYSVPKGNPVISYDPLLVNSENEDCQLNNKKNIISTEHFWDNPVFMKNTHRKMYVGSLEDKFIDIIQTIKQIFTNDSLIIQILDLLEANKPIACDKILNMKISAHENQLIIKKSSFFMKSLAHKTICELINPNENLNLGFFMKNDGDIPQQKTFNILQTLVDIASQKNNQCKFLKKPLTSIKEKFILKNINLKDIQFVNLWSDESKKGFLFSETITMKNEYRMFVMHNKVVATSACFRNTVPLNSWQNGRFDPRLVNGHNAQKTTTDRKLVAKYAVFARKFNREMKNENPDCQHYVLDVAWCEEKQCVVPIELNSITWSGAYQIDMHRACAGATNSPYNMVNYQKFFQDKCKYWLKMISNNIINPCCFDLAGLERTLQGKTLPELEKKLNSFVQTIKDIQSNENNSIVKKTDSMFMDIDPNLSNNPI